MNESSDNGGETTRGVKRRLGNSIIGDVPSSSLAGVGFKRSCMEDEGSEVNAGIVKNAQHPSPTEDTRSAFGNDSNCEEGQANQDYDPVSVAKNWWYGASDGTVKMFKDSLAKMPTGRHMTDLEFPPGLGELTTTQKLTVTWMQWRERSFPGGGVVVDNGFCKATEAIALITTQLKLRTPTELEAGGLVPSRATLIVVPLDLIPDWESKLQLKGKHLKICRYHGSKNTPYLVQDLASFDVILTTYPTVAKEIPKRPSGPPSTPSPPQLSPLRNIYWGRIILANATQIRNPVTETSEALFQLEARHRWALTETQIFTQRGLFSSICKFLRVTPFDDRVAFDNLIGLKKVSPVGKDRLDVLAKALIFTPNQQAEGPVGGNASIVPSKSVGSVTVQLSDEEESMYSKLLTYAQRSLRECLLQDPPVASFYPGKCSNIFAILTRLRQLAVLPYLMQTPLNTGELNVNLDAVLGAVGIDHFRMSLQSSKITQVLRDVENLRDSAKEVRRPMDKIVIVSFWTPVLDVIRELLVERDCSVVCITERGNDHLWRKHQDQFNRNKKPQVLLLNLLTRVRDLSLPAAKHLFFMEPHWNPHRELEVEGRVGQPKNLFIKRYIAEGTVETRIMELQQRNQTGCSLGDRIAVDEMKHLFEI